MADNTQGMTHDKLYRRWQAMQTERSSWWSHWQDITTNIMPRSGRYFRQDRDKGNKRSNLIYDNTAIKAHRTLGAGLMAGATSPARPWFRLATNDPSLNRNQNVKIWMDAVTKIILEIFAKSNTYRSLHGIYEELGAFGTGGSIILPDFDTVIHHYPVTIGEYCIAQNFKGQVDTLYREFEKPVGSMVREFGYDNCSPMVQNQYDKGVLDTWVPLIHAIEPREDRDVRKKDSKNMPWASYYFEVGTRPDKFLRVSGYKKFPAVVPRWDLKGGDIYGNSPGMEALGDVKQLQQEQLRKSQGIDYQTKPPLQVPTSMKNRDIDIMPGGMTFVDVAGTATQIQSLWNVNLNLQHLLADIQDVRGRIREAFYADLFLMLANSVDYRKTATEVAELQEEKLLMLGPVLERLQNELHEPLVEIAFTAALEAGILPQPPEELNGMDLNVEFVSMLAQAQRAIGTNSIDRFVMSLGTIANLKPDVLDKFNPDEWVDRYSDMLGIDPNLIVAGEQVAIIRKSRADARAAQAQSEAMQANSQTVKNLASAPTGGGGSNALQDIINQYSGYGSPSPAQV
jgi:hypothetical protein